MSSKNNPAVMPPGAVPLARRIGRLALWLLARPFALTVRLALLGLAVLAGATVLAVLLHAPWYLVVLPGVLVVFSLALLVQWWRLRRDAQSPVIYIAKFAYETEADEPASARHSYMLRQRLEAKDLGAAVTLRKIEPPTQPQAERIAVSTDRAVIWGHVITAGDQARWEAKCTVVWPDTWSGVVFFHRPRRAFQHAIGEGRRSAVSERLAIDAGSPLRALVAETLTGDHVAAIEGSLLALAAAEAESQDKDEDAMALANAALATKDHLSARVRALAEITVAVLRVKAGSKPEGVVQELEAVADQVNHDDMWSFLLAARYVGEFDGWSTPADRERIARRALDAAPQGRSPARSASRGGAPGVAPLSRLGIEACWIPFAVSPLSRDYHARLCLQGF